MKWMEKNIKYPKIIESIISVFLVLLEKSRSYRNLNNPIQFILKEMICLLDILQLIAMGDQRGGIDFALFDEAEDLGTVAAVDTAGVVLIFLLPKSSAHRSK